MAISKKLRRSYLLEKILLKNLLENFREREKEREREREIFPFERLACFYLTITGNFECFQYFNFQTNFLKNKNLFSKNWSTVFLVESAKIENATFQY